MGDANWSYRAAVVFGLAAALQCPMIDAPAQDTWVQTAKLVASDAAENDEFGHDVALSGDRLLVGAFGKANQRGAAYVFRRTGEGWVEEAALVPAEAHDRSFVGVAVALDGGTAVLAAWGDDTRGEDAGAVYVFVRNDTGWVEQAKLVLEDGEAGDRFGFSVAVDGDTIVVGAPRRDAGVVDAGSAFVFKRRGSIWSRAAVLVEDPPRRDARLGIAVAVEGRDMLVGAYWDPDRGAKAGAAHAFRWKGDTAVHVAKLTAAKGRSGDRFGYPVALNGGKAIVGAALADGSSPDTGAAFVYRSMSADGSNLEGELTAADGEPDDWFGWAVDLDRSVAAVGAYLRDERGVDSGAAYVYTHGGQGWTQTAKLVGKDTRRTDKFGWSIAVDGDRIAVGAFLDDDEGPQSGSVFVFERQR